MIQIPIERREEVIPEGYVKVVRCKNCKHFITQYEFLGNRCFVFGIPTQLDDYCSHGERKDEKNEIDRC